MQWNTVSEATVKPRARIDGAESVLLHNNSSNSSNMSLHKAMSAPSIHERALPDLIIFKEKEIKMCFDFSVIIHDCNHCYEIIFKIFPWP